MEISTLNSNHESKHIRFSSIRLHSHNPIFK